MRKRALRSPNTGSGETVESLSLQDLERLAADWLYNREYRRHSHNTLAFRRVLVAKLLRFFKEKDLDICGTSELCQFLSYVTNGHKEAGGRWGNACLTKLVRPRTVKDCRCHLRSLFN